MPQSIQTNCIILRQTQYSLRADSVVVCASLCLNKLYLHCCDIAMGDLIKRTIDVCMGYVMYNDVKKCYKTILNLEKAGVLELQSLVSF